MLVKGTPTQKRKIQTSLASFQNANPHIDLIAFVYEAVIEEETELEELSTVEEKSILGDEMYKLIDVIKTQLGMEKYMEVMLFIAKMKKKYVTDLRKNKVATEQMLVFFDEHGQSVVSSKFNSLLILKELQVFVPERQVLKKLMEGAKRKKNDKSIYSESKRETKNVTA